MDVHPKYVKFIKVGIIHRAINGARALIDGLLNAQGHLLNAPLDALEAYFEDEVESVDRKLILEDAQKEEEEDDGVLRLKIEEDEEPWQKEHREMYEKDEDD